MQFFSVALEQPQPMYPYFMIEALRIESYLLRALGIVILALAIWALIDCLSHTPQRYAQEGKRTKGFWTALTAGSAVVAALSVLTSGSGGIFQLIAACVACVYLADVRPAVKGSGGNWYNY